MTAVIILPTYNEKDNIADIVSAIVGLGIKDLGITIVDDNSPDGTGRIADTLARRYHSVSVIHRAKKEGLGKAYMAGFKAVLADENVRYIFEMDADFSHQPKFIPDFLEKIKTADIVLGSRYIDRGGVENWGLVRRFISWLANYIIRVILHLPYRDLTGGFKCFRREALQKIDFDGVESRGYNFQIELTYKAHQRGLRIEEIPIVFVERRAGTSKFNFIIMLESFWKVIKLRLGK